MGLFLRNFNTASGVKYIVPKPKPAASLSYASRMAAKAPAQTPAMKMARIILFTAQMDQMSDFYGRVLGLKLISEEKGWREFAAGSASIALHSGPSSPGRKGPKIVFHAADVAALRETLVTSGAKFGKVRQGEVFCLCDGKDPDGNPIQLSSR
jgi:catechol 2,3-dioxygenase-like lactoylglutathione lyase family enzyme